jgi:hypothetical protein
MIGVCLIIAVEAIRASGRFKLWLLEYVLISFTAFIEMAQVK